MSGNRVNANQNSPRAHSSILATLFGLPQRRGAWLAVPVGGVNGEIFEGAIVLVLPSGSVQVEKEFLPRTAAGYCRWFNFALTDRDALECELFPLSGITRDGGLLGWHFGVGGHIQFGLMDPSSDILIEFAGRAIGNNTWSVTKVGHGG